MWRCHDYPETLWRMRGHLSPIAPSIWPFFSGAFSCHVLYHSTIRFKQISNLKDAVYSVARMGGYLARNSDPPPGHQVIWTGFLRLSIMSVGYALRE